MPTSNAQVVNKLYTYSNFGSLTNANSFAGVINFQKLPKVLYQLLGHQVHLELIIQQEVYFLYLEITI